MKRKALFIINPISGGKKKDGVQELIEKFLNTDKFTTTTVFSDGVSHANLMAREAVNKFDLVVAVGGDGTVNEIASAVAGTNTEFGIIPFGSGNGLSRFLGISMDTRKAIRTLSEERVEVIDSCRLNGKLFFNMAGAGFDAHISEVFSHNKKRGVISYIKSSIEEIAKYQPQTYYLNIDGVEYTRDAFMLSFANSSQYGNNAHISPNASVQDGLIDVCIVRKFPLWRFPEMALRMLTRTAEGTKYVEIIQGRHVHVKRNMQGPVHIDGEPQTGGTDLQIDVFPASLKIIVGRGFKARS